MYASPNDFSNPKKGREFLGANKKVLSNTSSTEMIFTSHLSFESAIELGLRGSPGYRRNCYFLFRDFAVRVKFNTTAHTQNK